MKRLLYFLILIGSIILVSFYGGNISYLLFYFMLLLPILACSYSFYVYFRFKISQEMEHIVIKGQKVPYSLILVNEDIIPFTNISLNYFTERVTIREYETASEFSEAKQDKNLCLLPGEKIKLETKMYCKYRGTYPVGIRSVSITDFLGLFTITYPMKEELRVTVRPRIIPFEQLAEHIKQKDPKNNLFFTNKKQEQPDFELRSYLAGDPLKYIHWKNSAKTGMLMVRKQMPEELAETVLFLDLSPITGIQEQQMQMEDSIIETAISFAHHYCMKNIPLRIVFQGKEQTELLVNNQRGFEAFYKLCSDLPFISSYSLEQMLSEYVRLLHSCDILILITSKVTEALHKRIEENQSAGREIILIDIGELQL